VIRTVRLWCEYYAVKVVDAKARRAVADGAKLIYLGDEEGRFLEGFPSPANQRLISFLRCGPLSLAPKSTSQMGPGHLDIEFWNLSNLAVT
jgi:hypothetical protein